MTSVVIVGGGYGGALTARALQKSGIKVTLVDKADYSFLRIATLRALVEPARVNQLLIPMNQIHPDVIQGLVTSVGQDSIVIEGREEPLHFDYLVIATGASYAPVAMPAERGLAGQQAVMKKNAQILNDANSVLIIGGGPTAVEFAAEIATDMPKKEVTLVSSEDGVLPASLPPAYRAKVLKWLRDNRVNVITNERVDLGDPIAFDGSTKKTLKTVSGKDLPEADVQFVMFGGAPRSCCLKEGAFSGAVDENNRIRVSPALQIMNGEAVVDNVFALGDATNAPGLKLAYQATVQAGIVAANIKTLKKSAKLKTFSPGPSMMLVSLGRTNGALPTPLGTVTGFPVVAIKSKDMLVSADWKSHTGGSAPAADVAGPSGE